MSEMSDLCYLRKSRRMHSSRMRTAHFGGHHWKSVLGASLEGDPLLTENPLPIPDRCSPPDRDHST